MYSGKTFISDKSNCTIYTQMKARRYTIQ